MRCLKSLLMLCTLLAPMAAVAQQPFAVTWTNERLTVRAAEAPLADLVAEVARVMNIEIVGREKSMGRISMEFADQPMEKALAELLANVNYSIQKRAAEDNKPAIVVLASSPWLAMAIRPSRSPARSTPPRSRRSSRSTLQTTQIRRKWMRRMTRTTWTTFSRSRRRPRASPQKARSGRKLTWKRCSNTRRTCKTTQSGSKP